MATYPVYDEHGAYVGDYEWRSIPVLFKDNWRLEKGAFHLLGRRLPDPTVVLRDEVTGGEHEFTAVEFEEMFGFPYSAEIRTVQDVIAIHKEMRKSADGRRATEPVHDAAPGLGASIEGHCVVRDRNGCFLGVHDASEAALLWPGTRREGLVCAVPDTVEFGEALASIGHSSRIPTDGRRSHLAKSVLAAIESYPLDGMEGPAGAYWASQRDVSWAVVDDSDVPLCVVPYSVLCGCFGDEWFCSVPHGAREGWRGRCGRCSRTATRKASRPPGRRASATLAGK